MVELPFLHELALVAILSVLVTGAFARLQLPTVAGLLLAGNLAGPHGLRLVADLHTIEALAEMGVVLLLFTIGLEFSVQRLRDIFRQVALGGILQVAVTGLATTLVAVWLGTSPARAIFLGFVVALSSTAIVLRALEDRGELDAPHGRFIVGTLIFQDLCVIPMMLTVPVLASGTSAGGAFLDVGSALGKALLLVAALLVLARGVVPSVLSWVDASRSREVFLLAVLSLCIGTAWLTSLTGLSLALGAFLGGMVVADTDFRHRAMSDMLPLRDTFVSVFFVSLGMLFEPAVLARTPATVGLYLGAFVFGKGFLATLVALSMRFPVRAAWLAGVALAQFGEFGFVLVREGERTGLLAPGANNDLLAAGILSMFLTPILIRVAPHIRAGERLLAPLVRLMQVHGADEAEVEHPHLSGHVVLVGFGVAGQLVGRACARAGVPYIVLEMNVDSVRSAREGGTPIYYGDATSPEALDHAGITRARVAVVLINDPRAAFRVIDAMRRKAPSLSIFTRTRYLAECPRLLDVGATDVVAEEFEAGLEIVSRALRGLEIPRNQIDEQLHEARRTTQGTQRRITIPRAVLPEHAALADLRIESVRVEPYHRAVGASTLDLRQRTHALLVAIRRDGALLDAPDPGEVFRVGDVAYLVGSLDAVRKAIELLTSVAPVEGPAGVEHPGGPGSGAPAADGSPRPEPDQ